MKMIVLIQTSGVKSKHYFSFFFSELKGPLGSAGEAKLQNDTAILVSLSMISRLARLARAADPANFQHPSPAISRVYGLRTGQGGRAWTIVVASANLMTNHAVPMESTAPPIGNDEETDPDLGKVVS